MLSLHNEGSSAASRAAGCSQAVPPGWHRAARVQGAQRRCASSHLAEDGGSGVAATFSITNSHVSETPNAQRQMATQGCWVSCP